MDALTDFSGLSLHNMVVFSSLKWFLPLLIFLLFFFNPLNEEQFDSKH